MRTNFFHNYPISSIGTIPNLSETLKLIVKDEQIICRTQAYNKYLKVDYLKFEPQKVGCLVTDEKTGKKIPLLNGKYKLTNELKLFTDNKEILI